MIALCVAQTGSIFAADGWYYLTFTAGEVKEPKRTIPLSLVYGTVLVIGLYLLANIAYLFTLPFSEIQNAPDGRVATASLNVVLGGVGKVIMAIAIMISTFGANNGLILAGARVFYTMARDGLFFRPAGTLNRRHVPGMALIFQCMWACLLVLPRTRSYDETGAVKLDLGGSPAVRQPLQQPARLRSLRDTDILRDDDRRLYSSCATSGPTPNGPTKRGVIRSFRRFT